MWFPGKLCEEAHYLPLFCDVGLNCLGLKGGPSLLAKGVEQLRRQERAGSEKLLEERESENGSIRRLIYHKSDFPVNKVTLCKQLSFSQLAPLGEGHPPIDRDRVAAEPG